MKNIIILGVARSGKTTFARMLKETLGYSIISVDSFVTAFEENYPQIGIKHHGNQNHLITPFVFSYLKSIEYNHPDTNFVVEGWHMRLEDVIKLNNSAEIIVLGYPQLTPNQVLENVRKYEGKFDYTRAMTDEQLLEVYSRHVEHSINMQKQCREFNLTFIDTSFDRPKILEKTLKTLMERL